MIIAQLTDMHVSLTPIGGRVHTQAFLERAVAQLLELDPLPDVVLLTGDLVDLGTPIEYQFLRRVLAPLQMPVHVIPGNHDDRANLLAEFTDHAYLPRNGQYLHYVVDDYPVRLLALDTVIPGQDGGELCDNRLAWLEARLNEARDTPTLIFMHHPPFRTGIPYMDQINLANADAFGEIIGRHPQIERIVCGHVHRAIQTRFYGTIALTCPSTAHQIALGLRSDAPAAFVMEPPGFMLHVWDGQALVTHTVPIGEYSGPHLYGG